MQKIIVQRKTQAQRDVHIKVNIRCGNCGEINQQIVTKDSTPSTIYCRHCGRQIVLRRNN